MNNRGLKLRRSHRHIPEAFYFLLEGKPHPLLIPSVVEEVTSYLTLKDLKTCRLVCKSWKNEATKKARPLSKVLIQNEEDVVSYTKLHQQLPQSSQHISFELRAEVDLSVSSVKRFFELFGASIQFMYFNKVRWTDSELKDILFDRLPNLNTLAVEARAHSDRRLFVDEKIEILPKIKYLKLNVFSFITELTTPFLRDLLKACPNLEKISSIKAENRNPLPMQFIQYVCQELSFDTADDVVNMPFAADIAIAAALIDSQDVILPKLSMLDCNMRLRGASLQQLALKKFPIQQLDLTILADVQTPVLCQLFSGLESTLETLKLKFHPRCVAAEQQSIPRLRNLKSLTLNGYRSNLKFLDTFPKLECLNLIRINFRKSLLESNFDANFCSNVKCLEVYEDFSRFCTPNTVKAVIRIFPFVKRLKLENLIDGALTEVFRGYKNLEKLDAENGYYTDVGILGGSSSLDENDQPSLSNDVDPEPSIADLTELRHLSLASPKITDKSITEGVINCRSLRHLQLSSNWITDTSILTILDTLDLFTLQTRFCFEITKSMVLHAKKKLFGRHVSINEYHGPLKQSEIPKFIRRNGSVVVRMNKLNMNMLRAIEG